MNQGRRESLGFSRVTIKCWGPWVRDYFPSIQIKWKKIVNFLVFFFFPLILISLVVLVCFICFCCLTLDFLVFGSILELESSKSEPIFEFLLSFCVFQRVRWKFSRIQRVCRIPVEPVQTGFWSRFESGSGFDPAWSGLGLVLCWFLFPLGYSWVGSKIGPWPIRVWFGLVGLGRPVMI